MASITSPDLSTEVASIQTVNFGPGSRSESSEGPSNPEVIVVKQYHPDFTTVTGKEPTYSLLISSADSSRNPFFHNACVYLPDKDELYATSELLQSTNSSKLPIILISRVVFRRRPASAHHRAGPAPLLAADWLKLRPPASMSMPAGAMPYKQGVLYCSQGTLAPNSGGLWYMPHGKAPVPILTSFFKKPFNSIHSVTEDRGGGLWFTDPRIGFEQEIRPKPQLPSQVYRYDPQTGDLRAVADGFGRPTGIALSADEETLYVTDTEAARPDGSMDPTRPATIYAFDITQRFGSRFLANRRVFAYALESVPQALVCDLAGNVYAACGDGVEVWSPGGIALGLIEIQGKADVPSPSPA